MLANFKKIGVAAAVATAIGAAGAAQAVTLGEPGVALLVPHVLYDSTKQADTMVGVTVGGSLYESCGNPTLHWYFFSDKSVHLADGAVASSCHDFVRIDWGYVITNPSRPFPGLDGVTGYLVIVNAEGSSVSDVDLYGSAYLIQGNWESEAYIPVLPLQKPELTFKSGVLADVNPVSAGMPLAYSSDVKAKFSLRYFLDPALNGNTRLVTWFPENSTARTDMPIFVFDADENAVSNIVSMPNELNVLCAGPSTTVDCLNPSGIDGTTNDPTGHAIPDLAYGQPAIDSGFIWFEVADGPATPASRGGIAFSLIGVGASSVQVQTDLAHERGVSNY
ncbi:MAG: hypothetical protein KDJ54_19290 [Candidatus Competibacteraceae bacterium]|nr:hypothetical protein [Candidatus Competibacteraceae bacterium]